MAQRRISLFKKLEPMRKVAAVGFWFTPERVSTVLESKNHTLTRRRIKSPSPAFICCKCGESIPVAADEILPQLVVVKCPACGWEDIFPRGCVRAA